MTRIAVIKPCCIGDCVMALPAIDSLRAHYPHATIDLLVGAHSRAVFDMSPAADRVVEIDDQPGLSTIPRLARMLRDAPYDIVAVLDRSRALRAAALVSGADRIASVSFRAGEQLHESEVYLDVVRELDVPARVRLPRLTPPPEAREAASRRVAALGQPFVVLHPGGAQNPGVEMLDKRWPIDRWVELARTLTSSDLEVLISGGRADRESASSVATGAQIPAASVLAGKLDLAETAALVELAQLFVGGDTGMSHIAAAVGTPTVAIFGPTNPRRYRPLGPQVRIVAPTASWDVRDVDLRHDQPVDSRPSTRSISVSDVLAACTVLLTRAKPSV